MEGKNLRRGLFCDRDGTLIVDVGYADNPADVCLLPGAAAALRTLRRAGYVPVLISNQSGVGRGLLTAEQLQDVHARLVDLLAIEGAALDGAYYCLHAPTEGCKCRKPSAQMIEQACSELGLAPEESIFVGDKGIDVAAGRAAGCETVLIGVAKTDPAPDWSARSWDKIAEQLLTKTI